VTFISPQEQVGSRTGTESCLPRQADRLGWGLYCGGTVQQSGPETSGMCTKAGLATPVLALSGRGRFTMGLFSGRTQGN
jgi:hypothetical protein